MVLGEGGRAVRHEGQPPSERPRVRGAEALAVRHLYRADDAETVDAFKT